MHHPSVKVSQISASHKVATHTHTCTCAHRHTNAHLKNVYLCCCSSWQNLISPLSNAAFQSTLYLCWWVGGGVYVYVGVCTSPPVESWNEKTGGISQVFLFYTPLRHPPDKHTNYSCLPLSFSLSLALSLSGKPETYAEYFSLNRTTAELVLLKPIDRELYRRFDLVIKVRNTWAANGRCVIRFFSQHFSYRNPKVIYHLTVQDEVVPVRQLQCLLMIKFKILSPELILKKSGKK